MKKKFAAAFVAFALAMSMPVAAFAADDSIAADPMGNSGNAYVDTTENGTVGADMQGIEIEGQVNGAYANNFGNTLQDSKDNANNYADTKGTAAQAKAEAAARTANQAKLNQLQAAYNAATTPQDQAYWMAQIEAINEAITQAGQDAYDAWMASAKKYNNAVGSYANINGNEIISTFELQGNSYGDMVVTIYLDKSAYAGHTVAVLILNEDGTVTEQRCVVDANGCIAIEKNGFCVWTLVDCSGGLPAGTVPEGVSPSDAEKALSVAGNATDKGTSPKTGF